MRKHALLAPDQKEIYTYSELFRFIMSGFVVLLIDGVEPGIVFGTRDIPDAPYPNRRERRMNAARVKDLLKNAPEYFNGAAAL